MPIFALIADIISGVTALAGGIAGGVMQGEAERNRRKAATAANAAEERTNRRNQAELERSAKLEDANAVDALVQGSLLAGRKRMETTGTLWQQYLGYANSGVDANVGTPAQVADSSAAFGEMDALTIENNAARAAWGHKETASKYRRGVGQLKDEARTARIRNGLEEEAAGIRNTANTLNTVFGTTGSLLSTAGSVADKWGKK